MQDAIYLYECIELSRAFNEWVGFSFAATGAVPLLKVILSQYEPVLRFHSAWLELLVSAFQQNL